MIKLSKTPQYCWDLNGIKRGDEVGSAQETWAIATKELKEAVLKEDRKE